jgi:hypothetical protein
MYLDSSMNIPRIMILEHLIPEFSSCTFRIGKYHRIIAAVGKHVIAQDTLSGGDEGIGIDESADFGGVISALEIIEPGLCGA